MENNQHSRLSDAELHEDAKHLAEVLGELSKVIVGQDTMMRRLLIGLLTGGHVLLEGLPGLAKTMAVKTLAQVLDATFQRIQFTPDLLPSDLIGTMVYRNQTGDFVARKGPIFANIILADEINRAPAKVQSALLEAMAEKQVTIGESSYTLDEPFLVLATQNPLEQEGTYPLPEAQLDRFLFKLKVEYPTREEERLILERMGGGELPQTKHVFSTQGILAIRSRLHRLYVDERIREYILRIVAASRPGAKLEATDADPAKVEAVRRWIRVGGSPRATLFMLKASKAHAMLDGRTFVSPDDIKAVVKDILRHRLILTYEAEARGMSQDSVIDELMEAVHVP